MFIAVYGWHPFGILFWLRMPVAHPKGMPANVPTKNTAHPLTSSNSNYEQGDA
jgi:hypothetical protein